MIGADYGADPPTTACVHAAPWNPKELHLGPADDCWACGTMIEATLRSIERADRDNTAASIYSAIGAAVLFAVVLVAVVAEIWWTW